MRTPPAPMLASAIPATEWCTGASFDAKYDGWWMEQKFDGHRVQIVVEQDHEVHAWSRPRAGSEGAKPRELPQAVLDSVRTLPPGIYDGELYVPGGTSSDVPVKTSFKRYVIFDILELYGNHLYVVSYVGRREIMETLAKELEGHPIMHVAMSVPASWQTLQDIWARKEEGAIIKHPHSRYIPGQRSPLWKKLKTCHSAVLEVVGFEEGKFGPHSRILLQGTDGVETSVKTLNQAELAAIAQNPNSYIGRQLVISYQERTASGKYRHPMFDHWA